MGSVLSRDLFRVGFFGAEAELRLGFAFRSMLDRISPQFPSLFSCLRFHNSADPTISEPETAYLLGSLKRPAYPPEG